MGSPAGPMKPEPETAPVTPQLRLQVRETHEELIELKRELHRMQSRINVIEDVVAIHGRRFREAQSGNTEMEAGRVTIVVK